MSTASRRFTDKVAFVSGVARGQGREHAVRLASEGACVIGVDVCDGFESTSYPAASRADLDATVAAVHAIGGQIVASVVDVRDGGAVQDAVDAGLDRFGRLDLVVANAAVCSYGRLWELTEAQWHETLDVNLTGVWHTLKATVPALIDGERGGSIVIIGSGAGLKGLPMLGHYGATKWGVTGMARTLANELGAMSIRVNTVHPTAVRTPMGRDESLRALFEQFPEFGRSFGHILPTGSVDAADISDAVLWLLSEESRWVTGAAIPVDAGATQL